MGKCADIAIGGLKKVAAGLTSIIAVGSIIKSGFDRLIAIDTATAKLQALGHSGEAVKAIMANATASVSGTAFRMEDAVSTAAGAVAAGISPGKQLERYLSLTADTAAIAGTNMSEMGAIFNKVTTSGMIQAQELNQIADRGIPIFQMLADEMGVSAAEIRKLASDGKISSDIFLNAVESGFGGAAQTMGTASFKATLDNIGAAISRIGAAFLNGAGDGQGFFDQVKPLAIDLLNILKKFEPTAALIGQAIGKAFKAVHTAISNVIGVASKVGDVFRDNWSMIAPIVWGVIAALIVYNAVLGKGWLLSLKDIATKLRNVAITVLKTTADWLATAAIIAMTVAQEGLNAAMKLMPITWIVIGIIILIALFYAAVAAINHFTGESISATGVIAGAIMWLAALIGNIVIGTINAILQFIWTLFVEPFIGIIEWVLNVANGGFDSFGDGVANLIGNIISWFLSLGKVVTKIIDAIFGTDWTSGLNSLQDSVLKWGKNDEAITLDRTIPEIDRFDMTDAFNKGYDFGENLENKMKDFSLNGLLGDLPKEIDPNQFLVDVPGTSETPALIEGTGTNKKVEVDMSKEDLKYLRDMAEREYVNKFSTATLAPNVTFKISDIKETADVNELKGILERMMREEIATAAEGVY